MKQFNTIKAGVSTTAFAAVVVILILIAAAGFGLYVTNTGSKITTTVGGGQTITTTVGGSGQGTTSSISSATMSEFKTGGFANDQLVTFGYTQNYTCAPSMKSFGFNSTETTDAAAVTSCEVGGGNSSSVAGAETEFVLVPAYAGLSIFGVPSLGATSQGYQYSTTQRSSRNVEQVEAQQDVLITQHIFTRPTLR